MIIAVSTDYEIFAGVVIYINKMFCLCHDKRSIQPWLRGEMTWSEAKLAALKTDERTCAYKAPDWGEIHGISTEW